MVTLDHTGRLLSVSPSFEHVSGVPAAEATGQVFERFLHPDDIQRTWNEVRRVLGGDHAIDFETRLLHADGSLRVVSWRAVGAVIEQRLYAVGRDITEQKRAGERLARAQRLEALGQLTGGIAHDFNNILAAVLSYLEVGKLRADNPSAVAQALESAERAARRGAALVSQLMSFARQQQLSLRPVDLNGLLGGLAELLQRTLGAQVGLMLDLQPGLFSVTADPTQVEMVVLNLGINARDAMPRGGQLTVRTFGHAITEDPTTRIDDLPRGDYACLAVVDTGTGMDATTLAHCFEPFYSTKGPGHGTGLGLSQVLGVVQQCGGAVLVRSREGQGTSVCVYLPRARAEPPRMDVELPRPAPPSLPSATVLVVDDNPDVVTSTVPLRELVGFTARPARGP
jgi:PAS domain S-box-containing protein